MPKQKTEVLNITLTNGIKLTIPIDQVAAIMPATINPARTVLVDHQGLTWQVKEDPEDLKMCMQILLHEATTSVPFQIH